MRERRSGDVLAAAAPDEPLTGFTPRRVVRAASTAESTVTPSSKRRGKGSPSTRILSPSDQITSIEEEALGKLRNG
jgi:hypothetical protein